MSVAKEFTTDRNTDVKTAGNRVIEGCNSLLVAYTRDSFKVRAGLPTENKNAVSLAGVEIIVLEGGVKVKELTEENTRLRSQVPSMKKRMEEAQRQQRLEQENRRLREENSYLQYELEEERSFSERLTDGIGRLLDYLEERLPERLLPLLEKARELLPNPEIGRQQEQQQHQRGMGGMEL